MSNFLDNGAVLPHGLLGHTQAAEMGGFNKTYKNTSMRLGIVVRSYPVGDPGNVSHLTTEYDVLVFEQNEDKGSSIMTYRNCMSSEGLGSIADFFERSLRVRDGGSPINSMINATGQNGAVVLIFCLDGMTEKAIIMGAVTHPDRQTNLVDDEPRLVGEYNGVEVRVNPDGSTSLTFQGATDNDGEPTDKTQGNTEIRIEKEGSFQVMHDQITFRMDRTTKTATLNAKQDIDLVAGGNINITATANVVVKCAEADVTASGKINVKSGADTTIDVTGDCKVTASGKINAKAAEIDLNGAVSGVTTLNSHQGVIDFITGVPVQPSQTVKADV
jgi:hypothetical protein